MISHSHECMIKMRLYNAPVWWFRLFIIHRECERVGVCSFTFILLLLSLLFIRMCSFLSYFLFVFTFLFESFVFLSFCFTSIYTPTANIWIYALGVFKQKWLFLFTRKIRDNKKKFKLDEKNMVHLFSFHSTSVWCWKTHVNCVNFVRLERETFWT